MRRIVFALGSLVLLFMISCQKCMNCSYTYTNIEIIQTINGEEQVESTLAGYVLTDSSTNFSQECVKRGEDYTIEDAYILEEKTTDKVDFEYKCVES